MGADFFLLAVTGTLALGWSFINGMHRRDQQYKGSVISSASRFPGFTRRKLLRLVAPTRLADRLNHAAVIAGGCTIIAAPLVILMIGFGVLDWWQAPLIAGAGAVAGAYLGEFLFNSWGCAVQMPDEATLPRSERADGGESQVQNG
ncbi:MAG: hypothetical protein IH851_12050 [Armatimonadetes bacterium]|nr:hypothetical protein [Armatimonadota bacterium]